MATPKKPQDHQPKKQKPIVVDIELADPTPEEPERTRTVPGKQVTVDGIDVRVPDEALDDFEILDDIRGVQDSNDVSRMPSLLRRLVGDDYRSILDALRDKNTGRVPAGRASEFVFAVFEALNPSS
ncbi:hypothetical protein HCX50_16060 [Microbacterium oxydans]|uniref:hypothetical protein n=1 Tax=Microbacterium sp. B19(2022) TaxID=2914045 RepID=UPI001431CCFE|nr:hypothetical protein [Microbacterium sp. B19(2022)]NJI60944.1 hypothetical protein [Microbacterium sp. B19(2022)]